MSQFGPPVGTPAQRSAAAGATVSETEAEYAARVAEANARKAEADAAAAQSEAEAAAAPNRGQLTEGQQSVDTKFATDYAEWIGGGYQTAMDQLTQLDAALQALQSGQQLSGAVVGRLPTFVQQILYGDDPQNIQSNVQEVAVGTLRQILGAQFTAEEGVRISNMSYNPMLDEASNVARIRQTISELRGRAMAKQAAAEYFTENGTLAGYAGVPYYKSDAWSPDDVSRARGDFEQVYGAPETETVFERRQREDPTYGLEGGAGETYVSALSQQQNAALEEAWAAGASIDEIQRITQSFGSPPLDPAMLEAAAAERAKGPNGRPVRFVPFESERPLASQIKGAIADNPIGGPVMAFMAATAPTAAMDEFAGLVGDDPESTRFALDYLQSKYPNASFAGDLTGNIGYSVLGARALTAAGLPMLPANLASETLQGGMRGGFGAREDERLAGTLLGAGEGAAYGAVPIVASRFLNPRTPAGVTEMRQEGVPLSFGQTLGYPNAEATLAKIAPIGGDIAIAAQRRAFNAFPEVQLNRGLAEIEERLPAGLSPTERMGEAQRLFNEAYDAAKANVNVRLDQDMRGDVFNFRNRLSGGIAYSAENANRLNRLLEDEVVRRIGTNPSGQTYKDLDIILGENRAAFARQGNQEMVDGVSEIQRMIRDSARRNSAPEDMARLEAVDTGYAQQILAENAASRAGTPPGEYSPRQLLTAVQQGDASARGRAFARGEARGQDVAMTGVETLGENAPRVSALERGAGIAVGGTVGIPVNAALGIANAPGIRPVLNTLVAGQRPDTLLRAGRAIERNPAYLSGPISSMPVLGEVRSPPPSDLEALLAEYGVNPNAPQPTDMLIGQPADIDSLERKYAGQEAVRPLAIGVGAPAPVAPVAAPSTAQSGIVMIQGRPGRYDEATDSFIDVETGEVINEGGPSPYARGGRVTRKRPVPTRALKG
jgi:hypothetical protein